MKRSAKETPASRYRASSRPYLERLPDLEYPGNFLVKKFTTGGTFRFRTGSSISRMQWSIDTSARKRRTMGSEPSISTRCYWRHSTNVITSSPADSKCYLCSRTLLLPMFPAIQGENSVSIAR